MNAPNWFTGRTLSVDQIYRIFTDGSAIGNPDPGGWNVVVIQGKERWEMSGAHPWTTISEKELVAAVQVLRSVEGRARIELHSDFEYLIYGMRAYVFRWQRQNCADVLSTPKRLVFLGYSLPAADLHAQFIFRCGIHNQTHGRIKDAHGRFLPTGPAEVTIVNPDQDAARRIEAVAGPKIQCTWVP